MDRNIFTDEELAKNFYHEGLAPKRKFKWYTLYDVANKNIYPDIKKAMFTEVSIDYFWTAEEKEIIKRMLIDKEEQKGWHVEERIFMSEHLDFCVMYAPDDLKTKFKIITRRLKNELAQVEKIAA